MCTNSLDVSPLHFRKFLFYIYDHLVMKERDSPACKRNNELFFLSFGFILQYLLMKIYSNVLRKYLKIRAMVLVEHPTNLDNSWERVCSRSGGHVWFLSPIIPLFSPLSERRLNIG